VSKQAKRRRNRGWFRKGRDPRRSSYRFSAQDCRVGYLVAACKHPDLVVWLRMRIRCHYHNKQKAQEACPF